MARSISDFERRFDLRVQSGDMQRTHLEFPKNSVDVSGVVTD